MNKRLYLIATIIAIVLVTLTAYSCKTTKFVAPSFKDEQLCEPILKDTSGKYIQSDPFQLINAELDGRCLTIEVEYSGGCGGDTWTLVWNGMLMKSMPPKANIWLHLKDEDACRETVRKKLYFDISSVYNKGEVILLLKDFRGVLSYKPQ